MSTGKRLAKRSILGTRVACCLEDGKYYGAVICAVKNVDEGAPPVYNVRIEGERRLKEVRESDLVGSGFTSVGSLKLKVGQKVYITNNNRECSGTVLYHRPNIDEVLISVINPENGIKQDIKKRIEDIRLLESRKSARLADQDTDFAKLADMSTDRKDRKPTQTIDVPAPSGVQGYKLPLTIEELLHREIVRSRKRRSSRSEDDQDQMDECAAAMVLMKLSCSPRSPVLTEGGTICESMSPSSSVSSGVWSWIDGSSSSSSSSRSPPHRSATPSPPLSESSPPTTDDGLDLDESFFDDAVPRKRRSSTRTMFKCTWTGCQEMTSACEAIEKHIRLIHLGRDEVERDDSDSEDLHDEEFYWTEVEVNVATWVDPCEPLVTHAVPTSIPSTPAMNFTITHTPPPSMATPPPAAADPQNIPASQPSPPKYVQVSSPPTLSHMDMARPPHEDPLYKRHLSGPSHNLSSSWPRTSAYLSSGRGGKMRINNSPKASPGRGKRNGESRKCRKVYGMEQRDLWCTQCKWKKACSRFGE